MHQFRRLAVLSTLTLMLGCGGAATEPAPAPAPAPTTSPSGDPVGTETQDMGGTVD